jgi:ABC-type multidrug transport system permease subunit
MIFTILKKEAKQLLSDKGFLLIAFIQPLVFIIMFGSSFQGGDINHLDTIVMDNDNSVYSGYVVSSIQKSEFFEVIDSPGTFEENMKKLNQSEIRALIIIPQGFEENIDNRVTGDINVYLDSSNFLTYSSLSGAKVEIVESTLKNITKDILGTLEEEKELGKEKIKNVSDLFKKIKVKTDLLVEDIKRLDNLSNNSRKEIEDFIDEINSSLEEQIDSMNETEVFLGNIIDALATVQTLNSTEEYKKQGVISQITLLRDSINDSKDEIRISINKLDEINISNLTNTDESKKINKSIEEIKKMFRNAEAMTDDIDIDFKNLDKNFLSDPLNLNETAIHNEIKYFDYLGAGVLSLIVFFVCLLAPALNIIREKEENTLYRLSTTPASSLTLFIGKFMTFIIFGFIEMIYTLFLSIALYDLRITGSIYNVIIVLTLLACASISIGLFISSKVKTMQQALVIVPLIVIPSFLISNSFFPPDIMAEFMNYVSYITPMTYSNHALNAIMIKGFTLNEIINDIIALILFTLVPILLFVWSYKKIKY